MEEPICYDTQKLLDDLSNLKVQEADNERPWSPEKTEIARVKVVKFLRSTQKIPAKHFIQIWEPLHSNICFVYSNTFLAEAAFTAENLPGLLFWRLDLDWTIEEPGNSLKILTQLSSVVQDSETLHRLSANKLRTSSKFGPVSIHFIITDWINMYEVALKDATTAIESPFTHARIGMLESAIAALTQHKFAIIYDMPFVQEGIRVLTQYAGWLLPFNVMWNQIQNSSLTPLTRALFIICMIDEYLTETPVHSISELFADTVNLIKDEAFVSIEEAVTNPRTVHESRISSALAYRDPYVFETSPGMLARRLRLDNGIWESNLLSLSTPGIHIEALLHLLNSDPEAETTSGSNVAEHTRGIWEKVQASTSPSMLISTLAESGFTRFSCKLLRRFIAHHTLAGFIHGSVVADEHITDFQQTLGCLALVGGLAYQLVETYAPTTEYVLTYTRTVNETEKRYETLLPALGLPPGGLGQIMRRCFAPRPLIESIQATRVILLNEISHAEAREATYFKQTHNQSSGALLPQAGQSAVREAVLTWFDLRMDSRWGITPPVDVGMTPPICVDPPATGLEAVMITEALKIAYPTEYNRSSVFVEPSFVPYIIATSTLDALSATIALSFDTRGIQQALSILQWARDYGSGTVPNADGYRTKLSALITILEPFTRTHPPVLLPSHVSTIDSLICELHRTVGIAVDLLPQHVRPLVPDRPSITNSVFLATLYYDELYGRWTRLDKTSQALVENFTSNALVVSRYMLMLQKFFACRFYPTPDLQAVGICNPKVERDEQFGVWRLNDLADAVGHIVGTIQGIRTQMRVGISSLRTIMADASSALRECENLMTKTSTSAIGPLFSTMASRYARFTQDQMDILMRVDKLTTGENIPGLANVEIFLSRWERIATACRHATAVPSAESIATVCNELRRGLKNIQEDRVNAPTSYMSHARNLEDHKAAVSFVMDSRQQFIVDSGPQMGAVLTSQCNIGTWENVNATFLHDNVKITTTVRDVISEAPTLIIGQRWLRPDEILSNVDLRLGVPGNTSGSDP